MRTIGDFTVLTAHSVIVVRHSTLYIIKGVHFMAQATFSIRMDETLKKQFDSLCSDFGMNATTAFNIFAKAVVRERRIPFEISSPADTTRDDAISAFWEMRKIAEANGLQDMTLDDINAEIESVRTRK